MKLGVSIHSFKRTLAEEHWSVLEFLRTCADQQIEHVELLNPYWRDLKSELPEAARFLRDSGMTVSYGVNNNFVQRDPAARLEAHQTIVHGLEVASELGLKMLRVFAGNPGPDLSYDEAEGYILEGFRKTLPLAEAHGIKLALENHGALVGKSWQILELIRKSASSYLFSTFDVGNFFIRGEDPVDALHALVPYLANVHAKDFVILEPHRGKPLAQLGRECFQATICGEGDVPVARCLRLLKASGYRGPVALEFEGPQDERRGVREGIRYMKCVLAEESVGG